MQINIIVATRAPLANFSSAQQAKFGLTFTTWRTTFAMAPSVKIREMTRIVARWRSHAQVTPTATSMGV
jgi:hypothetical protein